MTRLLIVGDDLSGTAEAAGGVVAMTASPVELLLQASDGELGEVVAIDTNSRALGGLRAVEAVLAALSLADDDTVIYKKIDSVLRGNVAIELEAARSTGRAVIVALAVPRVGRTVLDGVIHLDGVPLHESGAWSAERSPVPRSIGVVLGPVARTVSLGTIRGAQLGDELRDLLDHGLIPVCDCETDEDLRRIAAAVASFGRPIVAIGAGGFVRALAPLVAPTPRERRTVTSQGRVCVVVGTQSTASVEQVERLVAAGVALREIRPGERIDIGSTDCVVTLARDEQWDERSVRDALTRLAGVLAQVHPPVAVVATGGSTARALLDATGIDRLWVHAEIEDGAVLSTTPSGAVFVTRPGGFGGPDSLVRIVDYVKAQVLV